MTATQFWMLWPDNPALSILVLALVALVFLYAARKPMHELIRAVGALIGGPLRLGARWLIATADQMKERNKAVLLAHGRHEVGQRIEREFERLGAVVRRDLQGYPTLQRKLLDEITRIEEDYKKCGEVPPPPPDWVEAVTAMANVKTGGSEMVQRILEEIKTSIAKIHDKAIGEYRTLLRVAAQDPRRLHAVLALGRPQHDRGQQEARRPAGERQGRRCA